MKFTRSLCLALAFIGCAAAQELEHYSGMCDASAAVRLDGLRILVASDEDNRLRVYREGGEPAPLDEIELSGMLGIDDPEKESDLEAVAVAGELTYWLSSHARNRKGRVDPRRHRLLATRIRSTSTAVEVRIEGRPYERLALDLAADPRFAALGLDRAVSAESKRLPRGVSGLDIEGLASEPGSGTLLLALRAPLHDGKAIVVPLSNPLELIAGRNRARFSDPILLDLGQRGIRGIEYSPFHRGFLLIARAGGRGSALFWWDGGRTTPPVRLLDLGWPGFSAEGLVIDPDGPRILILSDDGKFRGPDGTPCKRWEEPKMQRFSARRIDLPAPPTRKPVDAPPVARP